MSITLKPYPEYKDSGVPWLGKIPKHWKILRAKYVFREIDERSTTGEETHLSMSQRYGLIDSSKIDDWRLQSESYVGGKVCKKNDLVLNRLKAHLGVFAHAPQSGVVSPDYTVFCPIRADETRFFGLVFKTPI
jgi:type I restriction enzyme, S subunit